VDKPANSALYGGDGERVGVARGLRASAVGQNAPGRQNDAGNLKKERV
jgi:hypothetical protein